MKNHIGKNDPSYCLCIFVQVFSSMKGTAYIQTGF